MSPRSGFVALRQLNSIIQRGHKVFKILCYHFSSQFCSSDVIDISKNFLQSLRVFQGNLEVFWVFSLGMIHIWGPWKLSIYVQYSSTPLTLDIQFQANPPPSPNDNQSIKRKHNPRMTIICYQALPSGRLLFLV